MRDGFGISTRAFLAERDDWPSAIRRAEQERWRVLELTAITETLFDQLLAYLEDAEASLARFDRVSIHAPAVIDSSPRGGDPVDSVCVLELRPHLPS